MDSKISISKFIGVTGRVNNYIEQINNGDNTKLMPVSCTSYNYDNNNNDSLYNLLNYISVALRGGAGINVNLDGFKSFAPLNKNFYFYLSERHPDYKDLTANQKERLLTKEQVKEKRNTCAYISVNDSMEESTGTSASIQESWMYLINCNTDIIFDLNLIRPKNHTNKHGLVASGAVSFLTIYEAILNHLNTGDIISLMQLCGQINEVLRRGGVWKNGIVTFSLFYRHIEAVKYLNANLKDLPGSAKKSIIVDKGLLRDKRLLKLVEVRVNDKSVMLEKAIYKVKNIETAEIEYLIGEEKDVVLTRTDIEFIEQLYSQVCLEIIFKHRATCLLLHGNLGQIENFNEIPLMFEEGINLLTELHKTWKEDIGSQSSQYLNAEEDRQVGFGVIGLANLLAYHGIKYIRFVEALEDALGIAEHNVTTKAQSLVSSLREGYRRAAVIARKANLERAFTSAPTQTCAYRYTDLEGNTTCKNINPPLSKRIRRSSYTMSHMQDWYYHGDVETIQSIVEENGIDIIQRLWEAWQVMMNETGLAHCMSYDLYHLIDEQWLTRFLNVSPLVTTYYQVFDKIDQSYLNKSVAEGATKDFCSIDDPKGCISCGE